MYVARAYSLNTHFNNYPVDKQSNIFTSFGSFVQLNIWKSCLIFLFLSFTYFLPLKLEGRPKSHEQSDWSGIRFAGLMWWNHIKKNNNILSFRFGKTMSLLSVAATIQM